MLERPNHLTGLCMLYFGVLFCSVPSLLLKQIQLIKFVEVDGTPVSHVIWNSAIHVNEQKLTSCWNNCDTVRHYETVFVHIEPSGLLLKGWACQVLSVCSHVATNLAFWHDQKQLIFKHKQGTVFFPACVFILFKWWYLPNKMTELQTCSDEAQWTNKSSIRARYLVHTWRFFFIFCQKFGSDCASALY